jgi:hypothetical protein
MENMAPEKEEKKRERINVCDAAFAKVSVDSYGRIFKWKSRIFRAIYDDMVEEVRAMFSCGMIQKLVDERLFPQSWVTDYAIDGYGLVIEHEIIPRVTYPFEWSFEMLKGAAITVLKTNSIARNFGYQTKDCHAYNICFDKTTPLFVDLGSFVRVNEKRGWICYEDFLKSYYYPLRIWSGGNSFHARRALFSLSLSDEMPHCSYLLYKRPALRLLNLNRLREAIRHCFNLRGLIPYRFTGFSRLLRKINAISLKKSETLWGQYHNAYFDADGNPLPNRRFDRIIELIKSYDISSVVELGGNQGFFSEMLIRKTSVRNITCTDYDEKAVDVMYRNAKVKGLSLTPAVVDIMYPLMNYYDPPPYVRFRSDAVLALAVTHHLVLGQHLSIELFFEIVAKYSSKYVFIEFMPLGLWDGTAAPPLPSWYNQDWFKAAFEKFFNLNLIEQLDENRVLFLGEIRKENEKRNLVFY